MPSTRSKPVADDDTLAETRTSNPKRKTPQSVDVPNRTFILPSKRSDAARFLSLPNPSSGDLNRYFFDPEQAGLYEFTAVASTQFAPRSILFTSNNSNGEKEKEEEKAKGYLAKKAELLIATPIDVLFFMLPIVAPADKTSTSNMFQPLDDILDSRDELSPHLRYILYNASFRSTLEGRMQAICDSMEAADEKLYRFSETKLLTELIAKANRMIAQGLPASLEQNFIQKALAPPLMSVKREDTVTTTATVLENADGQQDLEVVETQSTSTTTVSTTLSGQPSGVSTPATQPSSVDEISASSESVARLLRLRIALSFMKQSYLPPNLSTKIEEMLKSPDSQIDFKPLDDRLKELADLRAEAFASRAIGDLSRKRGFEDEDGDSERAVAKRKKDEEKKAKAAESRAVRDLKKVNTSGMKKMSDFFKKKS